MYVLFSLPCDEYINRLLLLWSGSCVCVPVTSKCGRRRQKRKKSKRHVQQMSVRWELCVSRHSQRYNKHVRSTKYDPFHWNICWATQMRPYKRHKFSFSSCFVWFIRTLLCLGEKSKRRCFLENRLYLIANMLRIHWKVASEFNPQFSGIRNKDLQSALSTEIYLVNRFSVVIGKMVSSLSSSLIIKMKPFHRLLCQFFEFNRWEPTFKMEINRNIRIYLWFRHQSST